MGDVIFCVVLFVGDDFVEVLAYVEDIKSFLEWFFLFKCLDCGLFVVCVFFLVLKIVMGFIV